MYCAQWWWSVAIETAAACSTAETYWVESEFSVAALMDSNWRLTDAAAPRQVTRPELDTAFKYCTQYYWFYCTHWYYYIICDSLIDLYAVINPPLKVVPNKWTFLNSKLYLWGVFKVYIFSRNQWACSWEPQTGKWQTDRCEVWHPVSSCPASFPCGQQHIELLIRGRSLWNHSDSTDSWLPTLNLTEPQEELMPANATQSEHRGGNETELRMVTPRIVGGNLERRGGSPWQVWRHFQLVQF